MTATPRPVVPPDTVNPLTSSDALRDGVQLPTHRPGPPCPDVPLRVGLVAVLIAPLTIARAEEPVYRDYAQPRLGARIGAVGAPADRSRTVVAGSSRKDLS
ncbi:hypothetical protein BH708_12560 [Brachybacterium sp. P6-10-X1]|uniref:hypothetical protein n=1 Tax=Brachybacterium sp. P6-10-X1 TaxID=1903186 RepID=UPI0009719D6A|nr:hypothetical protein [Brachybacterium sp. P6-10-X1]APX33412.1 hypothetical protein BH708_12560 [Brachybacterium sp. P6-10-X1]